MEKLHPGAKQEQVSCTQRACIQTFFLYFGMVDMCVLSAKKQSLFHQQHRPADQSSLWEHNSLSPFPGRCYAIVTLTIAHTYIVSPVHLQCQG